MENETWYPLIVSSVKTTNIKSDFVVIEKKINMLDSISSLFDKSDDQVDNWTQILGFKHRRL